MGKTKKEQLTEGEHLIASFIEGLFILLIIMIVILIMQFVFHLSI
jgi:hypothetical protein